MGLARQTKTDDVVPVLGLVVAVATTRVALVFFRTRRAQKGGYSPGSPAGRYRRIDFTTKIVDSK